MTNTIAIWLFLFIVAAFAIDYAVFGWDGLYAIMRVLIDLIRWLAFWR